MPATDLIFAAGPILLLIFWMPKKTPMPSARALPLTARLVGILTAKNFSEFLMIQTAFRGGNSAAATPE